MQFADVLAASIHDIKNSLGLIHSRIDELLDNPGNQIADLRQAYSLKREVLRANNTMIQLLALYKMGSHQLSPSIQEQNLDEFLSELQAENQTTCQALGLEIGYACDPDLYGYFDPDLVSGVLNSTIGNAQRYAKTRILLEAETIDGYLVLRIQDDGPGYPASLLSSYTPHHTTTDKQEQAFSSGRTNLGLFFANQVAGLHETQQGQGRLQLSNQCSLGGSCFELYLP